MSKGVLWTLVAALVVTIAGYVVLKVAHVEGSDTLAIAISSIIAIFVAIQNSFISKDLEKVKNQTNGMTHHIMEEAKHLRKSKTLVEPADVVYDSEENYNDRDRDPRPGDARQKRQRPPRERAVPERTEQRSRDSDRGARQSRGELPRGRSGRKHR